METSPNLLWLDLEMTGLDVKKNRILEVALIVTDSNLKILDESTDLVVHQPKSVLLKMDKWNRDHHGASGLIERSLKSEITIPEVRRKLMKVIQKYCEKRTGVLCGNSIHADRNFIKKYFPSIDKYLSYRMIDVSSVKELAKRWYPEEVREFLGHKEVDVSHRALDDIKWSIKELEFYRKTIFK